MKTLLALRHVPFEDLGSFETVLAAADYQIRYVDAATADFSALGTHAWDLAVVLGGPLSANDGSDYPFLREELAFIERRLEAQAPTLGICLGGQLMAVALGARAYPAQAEIGWQSLTLSEAGRGSPLRHFAEPVFHWHGETFDLPAGAVHLASTPQCAQQAFGYGRTALALQFHPEVTARGLEQWYVGHSGELRERGLRPAELRRAARDYASSLQHRAAAFLREWLSALAPPSGALEADLGPDFDVGI